MFGTQGKRVVLVLVNYNLAATGRGGEEVQRTQIKGHTVPYLRAVSMGRARDR